MKVKTSITLSEDLLKAIDKEAGPSKNRSDFIETALWAYLEHRRREVRDAQDLEIINRHSERLNREALDVLGYQVEL